jgi:hypothetical protein
MQIGFLLSNELLNLLSTIKYDKNITP